MNQPTTSKPPSLTDHRKKTSHEARTYRSLTIPDQPELTDLTVEDSQETTEDLSSTSSVVDFEADSPERLRNHIKELTTSLKHLRSILNGALEINAQTEIDKAALEAGQQAQMRVEELQRRATEASESSREWERKFRAMDVEATGRGARLLDLMSQNDALTKEKRDLLKRLNENNHPARDVYDAFSTKLKNEVAQLKAEASLDKQTIARLQALRQQYDKEQEAQDRAQNPTLKAENEALRRKLALARAAVSDADARAEEAAKRRRIEMIRTAMAEAQAFTPSQASRLALRAYFSDCWYLSYMCSR